MLTSIRLKNFKTWDDTGNVRLAPLTVIFGPNSAGKSSLGHLLLALKQTALSTDRKRALHLGDSNSLIDLGTFEDCLNNHDISKEMLFELNWSLSGALNVKNPFDRKNYYGKRIGLEVTLNVGKLGQPDLNSLIYNLKDDSDSAILDIKFRGNYLASDLYQFKGTVGRKWSMDSPEKFYRFSDMTIARFQNAGFLVDFALETEKMLDGIFYLGPLRNHPQRIYQWSGDAPDGVGKSGEVTVAAILAAQESGRTFNFAPYGRYEEFTPLIASKLKKLGVIHSFDVKPVAKGRKEYEVLIKTHENSPEVKITDVGVGLSQVLPALVQIFYCPPNSTVWMEQPEIHLHPQVQAELADVFIDAINARENNKNRNIQIIIESHSEHFLNRLQRRIAEEVISPERVAIYFCKNKDGNAKLESLKLNEFGEIENWPDNFFGDEMADIYARTLAAMNRMKSQQDCKE